jgi:hypothetical protein
MKLRLKTLEKKELEPEEKKPNKLNLHYKFPTLMQEFKELLKIHPEEIKTLKMPNNLKKSLLNLTH